MTLEDSVAYTTFALILVTIGIITVLLLRKAKQHRRFR